MPNGGFPINLSIDHPDGEFILIGDGSKLSIYKKQPTKKLMAETPPVMVIDGDAVEALAGFLQYWVFGDDIGAQRSRMAQHKARESSELTVELAL